MNTQIGFATIKGKPIDIKGNVSMIRAMTSVIEQILGVIENYYPGEFELLKRLA